MNPANSQKDISPLLLHTNYTRVSILAFADKAVAIVVKILLSFAGSSFPVDTACGHNIRLSDDGGRRLVSLCYWAVEGTYTVRLMKQMLYIGLSGREVTE